MKIKNRERGGEAYTVVNGVPVTYHLALACKQRSVSNILSIKDKNKNKNKNENKNNNKNENEIKNNNKR